MLNILVTRDIPDSGLKLLSKHRGLHLQISKQNRALSKTELKRAVKGVDIILSLLTDTIDADIMQAAGPKLKLIANYAVGFDNVDLKAAKNRGITVTNAAGPEITESVAEHTLAMILALAHRLVETDAWTRLGKYKGWGPKLFLGTDLKGKTLGLIGGGAIGTALARRMKDGFEVKILYTDLKHNSTLDKFGAKFVKQDQLLKQSDFISLHVPLILPTAFGVGTPSSRHQVGSVGATTYHLISSKELKLMKPSAFLINTSRGPVVDELALVKALKKHQIAGAGLDVYECEPLIDCNPNDIYALRKLPNVVLSPHTASATVEARQAMSMTVAKNILAFLDGKTPPNVLKV